MIPIQQEGNVFSQRLCVPCYQTDANGRLTPMAFMDMAQEIAYWAAEALGFGYDSLHVHHTAWVLSRMHVRFLRPVLWRDDITIRTWHKGTDRLFYLRDFQLLNADGDVAVEATTSWVVMDERTRRLVRPEDLKNTLSVEQADDAIAEPAPKIVLPKEMEPAGGHTVTASEIDINRHTNNACYMAWAVDSRPSGDSERPVREFFINFNKETKEGECVQLRRLRDGDDLLVEGLLDGKSCFVVKLCY